LARLHRKTLCYSKSTEMLYKSIRLLIYYLKHGQLPPFSSSFLTVQYPQSSPSTGKSFCQ
ncbi:MAG: hypothetical protein ABWU11_24070, partial [Arthrospira platensis]